MEIASNLNTTFSTADADYPSIQLRTDELLVTFANWQECEVKILFSDVVAFSWEPLFKLLENERDDSCYEIKNSYWIENHINEDLITSDEQYSHFRFNFNEVGQLEVIAKQFSCLS